MMQMLDAGGVTVLTDGVRKPGDDNPRGYYEFEPVKRTREDATWIEQARGKAVKVVHLLVGDLPMDRPYAVVFMRRDLAEVVRSQQGMLERRGTEGAQLSQERLMEVFEAQLRRTTAWLADQSQVRVLEIDYNEMIRDPIAGAGAVSGFLGGGLDTNAMAGCVDPSLYRSREAGVARGQ